MMRTALPQRAGSRARFCFKHARLPLQALRPRSLLGRARKSQPPVGGAIRRGRLWSATLAYLQARLARSTDQGSTVFQVRAKKPTVSLQGLGLRKALFALADDEPSR